VCLATATPYQAFNLHRGQDLAHIARIAMNQDQDISRAADNSGELKSEKSGLYFNTAVLARFVRANYGDDALKEAQRHVALYERIKDAELAGIWRRVLAHLSGIEIVEDSRRVLKASKR